MKAVLHTFRRVMLSIGSRWRNVWFRALGMKIDGYAWIRNIDVSRNHHSIHIGDGVALDNHVSIICSGDSCSDNLLVTIGECTYINRHTVLDASQSLSIGRDCMIGPFCYITDHDHKTDGFTPPSQLGLASRPTQIGNRVWLGAHVTILKGVHIGEDTVVGAGSVVTKDLPAGIVAVGNPARILRKPNERSKTNTAPVALGA